MSGVSGGWQVVLLREPKKVLAKAPADLRRRLLSALHTLEIDPRPIGSRRLRGHEEFLRLRVGAWRIIYSIQDDQLIVVVIEIAPRGDAYRNL
jgi:mRNA interferase RelE/StbE